MTRYHLVLAVAAAIAPREIGAQAPAATQPAPSTDVYVIRLTGPRGEILTGAQPSVVNITSRAGYDNQPAWVGAAIYYTSQGAGQTDIHQWSDGTSSGPVVRTTESEYSAALTPDGMAYTVVRVERDSTQRLWRFPLGGGTPEVVLPDIKPVGYFAYLDSTTLALFVLGSPNTLQIADTRTGKGTVVTTDIGRSIQRVPGTRRASFTQRSDGRTLLLTVDATPRAGGAFAIDTVTALPDSAEYVTWRSTTHVYSGAGSRIFQLRLPGGEWEVVADLGRQGIRRISRLALSPDGSQLAFVAEERRSP